VGSIPGHPCQQFFNFELQNKALSVRVIVICSGHKLLWRDSDKGVGWASTQPESKRTAQDYYYYYYGQHRGKSNLLISISTLCIHPFKNIRFSSKGIHFMVVKLLFAWNKESSLGFKRGAFSIGIWISQP